MDRPLCLWRRELLKQLYWLEVMDMSESVWSILCCSLRHHWQSSSPLSSAWACSVCLQVANEQCRLTGHSSNGCVICVESHLDVAGSWGPVFHIAIVVVAQDQFYIPPGWLLWLVQLDVAVVFLHPELNGPASLYCTLYHICKEDTYAWKFSA